MVEDGHVSGEPEAIAFQIPLLPIMEVSQILYENTIAHNPDTSGLEFTITIRLGPRPVIEFTDNGKGINGSEAQKIFEPFYSAQGIHRIGLGLPIARSIARERIGGGLHLEFSDNSTDWRLVLPL